MKKIYLLIVILPYFIFSQNDKEVLFYVDSIKVSSKTLELINFKKINTIEIIKKENAVYINLKKDVILKYLNELKFLGNDILPNKHFFINNKFVNEPFQVLVDSAEIGTVKIIKDFVFENEIKKVTLIKITTRSELKKRKNTSTLYIR